MTPEADLPLADSIASECGFPRAFARLLVSRGLADRAGIDRFLSPRLSELGDPFRLAGMEAGVARIWQAIDGKQMIAVFGDYDADGIVACGLMVRVLRALGARVGWCIPDRRQEGYGLSLAGLDRCLAMHKPGLVITVDCGTNDIESVESARARGVDVVVTDHHEVQDPHAAPAALINPRLGSDDGSRRLSGAGVAFKLCHALLKRGRDSGRGAAAGLDLREYLDIVAAATVADVVPLVGDNRILVSHGLARLNTSPSVGLAALMQCAGLKSEAGGYHLGFVIGPRLNAAGRIAEAETALELILADDAGRAAELAQALEAANTDRKIVQNHILDHAHGLIAKFYKPSEHFGIVVGAEGWNPGVLGIVAGRLCDMYHRPVAVVTFEEDGSARGSCRSIPGFDVAEGLGECRALLRTYGGHSAAAGVTLDGKNFDAFRERFNAVCRQRLKDADLRKVQRVDAWIDLAEADETLLGLLRRLQPFGEGNPEPVWGVSGAVVMGKPRIIKEKHLKMNLAAGSKSMEAIAFGMGERQVPDGPVDVAFVLERNSYAGIDSLQMKVQDFRPAQGERG